MKFIRREDMISLLYKIWSHIFYLFGLKLKYIIFVIFVNNNLASKEYISEFFSIKLFFIHLNLLFFKATIFFIYFNLLLFKARLEFKTNNSILKESIIDKFF